MSDIQELIRQVAIAVVERKCQAVHDQLDVDDEAVDKSGRVDKHSDLEGMTF
jgi:hypothetical protein